MQHRHMIHESAQHIYLNSCVRNQKAGHWADYLLLEVIHTLIYCLSRLLG